MSVVDNEGILLRKTVVPGNYYKVLTIKRLKCFIAILTVL
ncbi:hypothetical protein CPK_ORF00834 [Chlamydia pneumoniae LPCoLN]|nr:hypothetical protein CPK_ORF00834 [Chlamydia pneumoniae LPCoLN]